MIYHKLCHSLRQGGFTFSIFNKKCDLAVTLIKVESKPNHTWDAGQGYWSFSHLVVYKGDFRRLFNM